MINDFSFVLYYRAMESLFKAYSNFSDDYDEEDEPKPKRLALSSSPSKRPEELERFKFKPNFRPSHYPDLNSQPQEGIMVPGRYVSKRERSLLSSAPASRAPESFFDPSLQSSPGICLFRFLVLIFFFR